MPLKVSPLKEASEQARARRVLPTPFNSREIAEMIAPEIRARATFSARVESARVLDAIRKGVSDVLNLAKRGDMTARPDEVMLKIQRIAESEGVFTGPAGTIRDIQSVPRLRLIAQMNEDMAVGYSRWKTSQAQIEGEFPAWEFTRVRASDVPRQDWPERWEAARDEVDGEGVATNGQMIALKNSPIWAALSAFGTPWEPFDWGSGMGVVEVDRDTAIESGALVEGADLAPLPDKFNANLRASVTGMDPAIAQRLDASMGDSAAIIDGELVWGD